MIQDRKNQAFLKKSLLFLLTLALLTGFFPMPVPAAREGQKTVRAGWYESPFCSTDTKGRRSGYAYEYQMKISAYSGWEYNYVNGSWTELMDKLAEGKIDILSDVSYTEERAQKMLFSELPMGTEEYYIYVAPDEQEITPEDYSSLNGKRIGVNKNSIQAGIFQDWAREHDVQADVVELTTTEVASLRMMAAGELDAFVSLNAYGDPEKLIPVCKIGSSDFYFAVNKDRPDLLSELNAAMSRIQDEDPYYNERMFELYIQRFGVNAYLSPEEAGWLEAHGPIRVGYQNDYLAFCAKDPMTGELKGALKDYLEYASGCLPNVELRFEAEAYPTAEDALLALQQGEVDCVFPANLGSYDGESMELVMTPPLMRTDIFAVVRERDADFFEGKEHVVVAVNRGNLNYDAFLRDNFPEWTSVYYPATADCLKAVDDRVADCVLISSYRYNNISRLCKKYHLVTFATGKSLDYCFAVKEGDTELYSVLARVTGMVPGSTVNAALSKYLTEDAKLTFADFLNENLPAVIAVIAAVIVLIFILMLRSMRSERKARLLIKATETDNLTGLYNRDYFFQYANRMYREASGLRRDALVLNLEQFHSINALNGWEFGDQVLRALGEEVLSVARERNGIAGRFGADRFDIYCLHTEDYQAIFKRLQGRLDDLASNASIRLRMGVMPAEENLEPLQQFDMARAACSMARGHYKEHLIVFNDSVREKEILEQRLQNDLRRALDSFEFDVYYQPKYDIQSDTPRLMSAEALIRWQHPELGLISPDSFIPVFEKNGKIGEVDKYVWAEAAKQIAKWRAEYGVTLPVSVNLSRVDVFDPALEETLDGIVRQNGLEQEVLKLEVTESAYTENADQVIRVVERLRRKGYVLEMDDFGTGYSSLNMLSAMPVDVLKMDRMFIRNIEHSEKDIQLVALILGIAKSMNIPVIAEGVETEEQIRLLKDLGCQIVQGYYFSKPLHPKEFEIRILQRVAEEKR